MLGTQPRSEDVEGVLEPAQRLVPAPHLGEGRAEVMLDNGVVVVFLRAAELVEDGKRGVVEGLCRCEVALGLRHGRQLVEGRRHASVLVAPQHCALDLERAFHVLAGGREVASRTVNGRERLERGGHVQVRVRAPHRPNDLQGTLGQRLGLCKLAQPEARPG